MKLFYRETGSSSHPPLLLLHGLWGASENWLPVAHLLEDFFHVFLPDLRNHGQSPHSPLHSYTALAEDIQEFIAQREFVAPPFAAGHSMGGKALMTLLLQKPACIQKAAILDIAPKTYSSLQAQRHRELLSFAVHTDLSSYENHQAVRLLIEQSFPNPDEQQLLLKNITRSASYFTWKINAPVLLNELSEIIGWNGCTGQSYTAPILFLRGEYSGYLTIADLPLLRSYFPVASLQTIPGASHRLHAEQPQQVARLLKESFLYSQTKDLVK